MCNLLKNIQQTTFLVIRSPAFFSKPKHSSLWAGMESNALIGVAHKCAVAHKKKSWWPYVGHKFFVCNSGPQKWMSVWDANLMQIPGGGGHYFRYKFPPRQTLRVFAKTDEDKKILVSFIHQKKNVSTCVHQKFCAHLCLPFFLCSSRTKKNIKKIELLAKMAHFWAIFAPPKAKVALPSSHPSSCCKNNK